MATQEKKEAIQKVILELTTKDILHLLSKVDAKVKTSVITEYYADNNGKDVDVLLETLKGVKIEGVNVVNGVNVDIEAEMKSHDDLSVDLSCIQGGKLFHFDLSSEQVEIVESVLRSYYCEIEAYEINARDEAYMQSKGGQFAVKDQSKCISIHNYDKY